MYQLDFLFVLLAQSAYQLDLTFVFLPSVVHLLFKDQQKCTYPDCMYAHSTIINSLTTAFELALPTREIRLIDNFFATFKELPKLIVL